MILRGVDRQARLLERLGAAIANKRHTSYLSPHAPTLFAQRIYLASGRRGNAGLTQPGRRCGEKLSVG